MPRKKKEQASEQEQPKAQAKTKSEDKKNGLPKPTLLTQYEAMKAKHPDAILLFRVGDFYECIDQDAIKASQILQITLTRSAHTPPLPLAGFPHHALDTYLPKLVRAGMRVAICEQLEDPKQTVKRGGTPTEIITPGQTQNVKETATAAVEKTPKIKEKSTSEISENKAEAKAETKNEPKQQRPPQMVTPNGGKVTHAHAYQGNTNPHNWYFTAKLDGVQLKPQLMTVEDAAKYANKELSVPELMQKYYPTKLMEKVPAEAYVFPNVIEGPEGNMTVHKFNVYKETNQEREDYGKYKFYAKVDDRQMSTLASKEDLNAFFDRVMTPGQLVEKNFGEKLGLASAYQRYVLPDEVKTEQIRISKLNDKNWGISVDLGEKGKTAPKVLSYDDAHSYFHWHSASREQLAQKYLGKEIEHLISGKLSVTNADKTEQQSISSPKGKSSYLDEVKLTDFLKALGQPEPIRKENQILTYNVPYSASDKHYLHVNTANNSWMEVKGEYAYAAGGVRELASDLTKSRDEMALTMYVKGVMDAYSRMNPNKVAVTAEQENEKQGKSLKL